MMIHLGEIEVAERERAQLAQEHILPELATTVPVEQPLQCTFVHGAAHCIIIPLPTSPNVTDGPPLSRRLRIFRGVAIGVSVLVVILMGMIGWRIREARENARLAREPGIVFSLAAGDDVSVQGFQLAYKHGQLLVVDPEDRIQARFTHLQSAERRGWQELQIDLVVVTPDLIQLGAFIRPGSACYGSGRYRVEKPGLRIEFPGHRTVTVLGMPPEEWRLKIETGETEETVQFATGKGVKVAGLNIQGSVSMENRPAILEIQQTH